MTLLSNKEIVDLATDLSMYNMDIDEWSDTPLGKAQLRTADELLGIYNLITRVIPTAANHTFLALINTARHNAANLESSHNQTDLAIETALCVSTAYEIAIDRDFNTTEMDDIANSCLDSAMPYLPTRTL